MADALNAKQQRFVEEYLVDGNATRAYRAAYPRAKQTSAEAAGPRLLGNVRVAAAIEAARREQSERAKVKQDRVLEEIDTLALSDTGDLFDLDADALRLLPMKRWPAAARRAVASVKVRRYAYELPPLTPEDFDKLEAIATGKAYAFDVTRAIPAEDQAFLQRLVADLRRVQWEQYEVLEIKLWDKNAALANAGKARGMFVDRFELRDKTLEDVLKAIAGEGADAEAAAAAGRLVGSIGEAAA